MLTRRAGALECGRAGRARGPASRQPTRRRPGAQQQCLPADRTRRSPGPLIDASCRVSAAPLLSWSDGTGGSEAAWRRLLTAGTPTPAERGARRRASRGGGSRGCAPRCCSAFLRCVTALAQIFAQLRDGVAVVPRAGTETGLLDDPREQVAGRRPGRARHDDVPAGQLLDRGAHRTARRPAAARPSQHRPAAAHPAARVPGGLRRRRTLRRPQLRGRGLAAAPPMAPPQRLRRERSAVPPRRRASSSSPCRCTEKVAQWLFLTVAFALACSIAAHAATGAIRTKPPPVSATRGAHAHLLVARRSAAAHHGLAALARPVRAASFHVRARSSPARGTPTCTSCSRGCARSWWSSLVGAAMLLYGALRRSWALPAVALVVVAFAELANPAILPSVVQRVFVDPQTLSRERPYLAHSVRFTQLAYGLDRVADRPLPANATISDARAAVEPGRPPEHPALGYRRPADRRSTSSSRSAPTTPSATPRSTATARAGGRGR